MPNGKFVMVRAIYTDTGVTVAAIRQFWPADGKGPRPVLLAQEHYSLETWERIGDDELVAWDEYATAVARAYTLPAED